jgi:putative SOS response-associated peptidase YedK
MCGRFTQTRSWQEIVELYKITEAPDRELRPAGLYNIAPTQDIAVLKRGSDGRGRALVQMRWGLVPPWAGGLSTGSRMINARAESVAAKPAFRSAFRERRCLIVADGFYEWQKRPGRAKQPYHVAPAGPVPFAFAGLWERWRGPAGERIETCAIITTGAAPALAEVHDRMPAILGPDDFEPWLDPDVDPARVRALLHPFAGPLSVIAVSNRVNDVRNEDPACLEPPPLLLC